MPTFEVSGLEFIVITGNIFKSEWRNPPGTWFCQIIPTGTQLIHLIQEIQNQFIKINAHVLDYDYEANPLEGRITLADKGVHLAPIYMFYDYGVYPAPKTDVYLLQYADLAQPERRASYELVGTLNV